MGDVSVAGPTRMRRTWCQAGRHVALAPPEDDHGLKIPFERCVGCFVWSMARCVGTLRMYHGLEPHLLTDFMSG